MFNIFYIGMIGIVMFYAISSTEAENSFVILASVTLVATFIYDVFVKPENLEESGENYLLF